MTNSKVIDMCKFKEKVEEKEAQEIVDYVLDDEYRLVKFLAKAFIEMQKDGREKLGQSLIEEGIKTKANQLKCRVWELINEFESSSN